MENEKDKGYSNEDYDNNFFSWEYHQPLSQEEIEEITAELRF